MFEWRCYFREGQLNTAVERVSRRLNFREVRLSPRLNFQELISSNTERGLNLYEVEKESVR